MIVIEKPVLENKKMDLRFEEIVTGTDLSFPFAVM
jgi:hypothetical protein